MAAKGLTSPDQLKAAVEQDVIAVQNEAKAAGKPAGRYGPNRDGVDGKWGPATENSFGQMGGQSARLNEIKQAAARAQTTTPAHQPGQIPLAGVQVAPATTGQLGSAPHLIPPAARQQSEAAAASAGQLMWQHVQSGLPTPTPTPAAARSGPQTAPPVR